MPQTTSHQALTSADQANAVTYHDVPVSQLTLVRVQAGLEGARADGGDLILSRSGSGREDRMNSFHFALNGPVASHLYGSFDSHTIGIIANAKATAERNGSPAGLSPADTWFHADEAMELALPGATLVVPDGVALPAALANVRVVRYTPGTDPAATYEARNAAIRDELARQQLPVRTVTMHGWQESGVSNADEQLAASRALGAPAALPGNHLASPDGGIDAMREAAENLIEQAGKGERLYDTLSGAQMGIEERLQELTNDAAERLAEMHNPHQRRFYETAVDWMARATETASAYFRQEDFADKPFPAVPERAPAPAPAPAKPLMLRQQIRSISDRILQRPHPESSPAPLPMAPPPLPVQPPPLPMSMVPPPLPTSMVPPPLPVQPPPLPTSMVPPPLPVQPPPLPMMPPQLPPRLPPTLPVQPLSQRIRGITEQILFAPTPAATPSPAEPGADETDLQHDHDLQDDPSHDSPGMR